MMLYVPVGVLVPECENMGGFISALTMKKMLYRTHMAPIGKSPDMIAELDTSSSTPSAV